MQILVDARKLGGMARVYLPDADTADAVLMASRSLTAVATRSAGRLVVDQATAAGIGRP
jgi:hypothetical protein